MYLSTLGGMYAVAQMCVRMTRRVGICVLLSLQKPVLCVCFHASLCVVWCFRVYVCAPLLAVALSLSTYFLSWIVAVKDANPP